MVSVEEEITLITGFFFEGELQDVHTSFSVCGANSMEIIILASMMYCGLSLLRKSFRISVHNSATNQVIFSCA
jgi:hypothetical protein